MTLPALALLVAKRLRHSLLESQRVTFTAALNPKWRRRAYVRAGLSVLIAVIFAALYFNTLAIWYLAGAAFFIIFAVLPIIIVSRCTPPVLATDTEVIVNALRKHSYRFDHIDNVQFDQKSKVLRLTLISGDSVAIPTKLLDKPQGLYTVLHNCLMRTRES